MCPWSAEREMWPSTGSISLNLASYLKCVGFFCQETEKRWVEGRREKREREKRRKGKELIRP